MATNPHFSTTAANAEAAALAALLNNGYLRLYAGSQPANADTAISGPTLLATCRFGSTAFGAPAGGVIIANAIASDTAAAASGTATFFRCFQSDGTTAVYDGSIGVSAADMLMNSAAIQAGAQVDILALSITIAK